MAYRSIVVILLIIFLGLSCTTRQDKNEISVDNAIRIASGVAQKKNYDVNKADIEVIKVKNGLERGPIRLVWLARHVPKEKVQLIISKELWIIYFYPKASLSKGDILGGDFTVFIDLHSGEVFESYAGL